MSGDTQRRLILHMTVSPHRFVARSDGVKAALALLPGAA